MHVSCLFRSRVRLKTQPASIDQDELRRAVPEEWSAHCGADNGPFEPQFFARKIGENGDARETLLEATEAEIMGPTWTGAARDAATPGAFSAEGDEEFKWCVPLFLAMLSSAVLYLSCAALCCALLCSAAFCCALRCNEMIDRLGSLC